MILAKDDFRSIRANFLIAHGQKTIRRKKSQATPSRIVIVKIEFRLVRSKGHHLLIAAREAFQLEGEHPHSLLRVGLPMWIVDKFPSGLSVLPVKPNGVEAGNHYESLEGEDHETNSALLKTIRLLPAQQTIELQ
jgi:hypothetical protein